MTNLNDMPPSAALVALPRHRKPGRHAFACPRMAEDRVTAQVGRAQYSSSVADYAGLINAALCELQQYCSLQYICSGFWRGYGH